MRASLAAAASAVALGSALAAEPPPALPLDRGQVVVDSVGCGSCHSPANGPVFAGQRIGGMVAPNITPDPISGIGGWSRDDVVRYLRTGRVAGRGQAAGSMALVVEGLQQASDADLVAVADWLRRLPPVRDPADQAPAYARGQPLLDDVAVRGVPPIGPSGQRNPGALFSGACASCHGPTGAGSADATYPSLFHNSAVGRHDPANLIFVMLHGVQRTTAEGVAFMPGFDRTEVTPLSLTDDELASLANYVLTQFGDPSAAHVTAADFVAARQQ